MMKLLNWTEMFSLSNDTNNKNPENKIETSIIEVEKPWRQGH